MFSPAAGQDGRVLADEVLVRHVVLRRPLADRRDCRLRQGVHLGGIQPHGPGPLHCGHEAIENLLDGEHLLLGNAEEIVCRRPPPG